MVGCNVLSDLTRRYVTRTNTDNNMNLTPTDGWTVIKGICSLLTFTAKPEGVTGVKWRGLSLASESFINMLEGVGVGTLNLEPPSQTPKYIGILHSVMLEKVPNTMELLRLVDTTLQGHLDDARRLKAVKKNHRIG